MFKLLINKPNGEQSIELVDQDGAYFDQSRIIWDERTDGSMPPVILGKMERVGDALVEQPDYLPEHADWLALHQSVAAEKQRVEAIRQSALDDALINQLRGMNNAEIDTWCDANISSIADLKMLMKKIIRILVAMNEGK